jgi:hypothetical protein
LDFIIASVLKQDGDIRITIDYKPLNRIIKNDNYPLPNISDIYKQLAKTNYFSKIDIKRAYYQIECDEQSKKYTAFVCEFGIFEYEVMPMGIKTAPACFQRFIVEPFNEFIDQNVLQIYLNDFIVNTRTIEEHQDVCNRLLNKMITAKIKCADKKSKILTKEVEFLGNTISDTEIFPNKD